MVWEADIRRLAELKERAGRMGGEEGVARHHARGKLTVRERIDLLADDSSFEEIGSLTGSAVYEGDRLVDFTPGNTVMGLVELDGRRAVVSGGDFTVRGGAADAPGGLEKADHAERLAFEWRLPYIRLLDATGGSVRTFEQIGYTYIPWGPGTTYSARLMQVVPVVSLVLGSVAGLPAVETCLAHFSVMVKGTSQVFVAGPPVVKAALGHEISKEDLGNERVQVRESGVVNNMADSEAEAMLLARGFLSYLPPSVWELPPRVDTEDAPDRREESLIRAVPREKRRPYDPRQILTSIMDQGSVFELAPCYGGSRITALARLDGYPVGVMINDPNVLGGAMDVSAADKATRFVDLCNTFHLPVIHFVDEPGFMVGLASEKKGMLRLGARVHTAIDQSRVPWLAVIIRQVYGVAGGCHLRASGMHRRYAWPSGNWGSMHIEGGAMAAYRREIQSAPDPEAKRLEIEDRLRNIASPFRTAHAFDIEEIIDPRDTRPLACRFVRAARDILKTQLGPPVGPSYRP
ncbi:MAG: methylmalonyl-CoA carboxyltransferase [Proteobacteria bacterium]|nr:methylmalonyl-CoA carboxyltransferase [Pseudomonadota bacterium]